jgi:hypothetical protein
MNPAAIKYTEEICKKASDEGYTLQLAPGTFTWKDKTGNIFGEHWNLDAQTMLHQACIFIQEKMKWEVEVLLD